MVSKSSPTMPASSPSWLKPRSVKPSCTKWCRAKSGLFRPCEGICAYCVPRPALRRPFQNCSESASIARPCRTRRGQSGFLETDHDPEDQTLPRRLATCASLQIEGPLVCGVPHPCSVPRGQKQPWRNRRGAEALS